MIGWHVSKTSQEENSMELTKELKEKLEKAENKEDAKKILEEAGVELTEEELDQVAGGKGVLHGSQFPILF